MEKRPQLIIQEPLCAAEKTVRKDFYVGVLLVRCYVPQEDTKGSGRKFKSIEFGIIKDLQEGDGSINIYRCEWEIVRGLKKRENRCCHAFQCHLRQLKDMPDLQKSDSFDCGFFCFRILEGAKLIHCIPASIVATRPEIRDMPFEFDNLADDEEWSEFE